MSFSNDFDFQVSAFYRAPEQTTQGTRKAFYMVDLGFSKEVLNNRGTLALNVRDLLNSRKWRTTTTDPDGEFFYDSEFQWRTRTITLSFDYRIKSSKKKEGRDREEGNFEGGGDEY
jgi:hypothetical protein